MTEHIYLTQAENEESKSSGRGLSNDRRFLEKSHGRTAPSEIFTNFEACEFLRISPVTLWRERKAGKISFRRVSSKIIYLREDLEEYLERNKRKAFAAE